MLDNPRHPSTQPTKLAAAAAEATQPAPMLSQEPMFDISGQTFFAICQYVGSKPLRQVIGLRQFLWQVQREQNALQPQSLPAKIVLPKQAVDILMNYLMDSPCDEAFPLLQQFEQDIQAYVRDVNEKMAEAQRKAQAALDEQAALQASAAESASTAANDAGGQADAPATNETAAPEAQPQVAAVVAEQPAAAPIENAVVDGNTETAAPAPAAAA